jgi:maleylpyruvate isomerase
MKLYQGFLSSASWRVRWALAIKRLKYESIWLDIASGEHLRVLANKNPLLSVPTLELDDGDLLTESVAIIEWLEESFPDPGLALLPRSPRQRARVRELVQLVNAGIHPLQNTIVRRAIAHDEAVQYRWCARWIERGLQAYESQLRKSASLFSVGDTLTMADLYLVPQAINARRFGADIRACTRVQEVVDACLATPEAQRTHPDRAVEQAAAARRCCHHD